MKYVKHGNTYGFMQFAGLSSTNPAFSTYFSNSFKSRQTSNIRRALVGHKIVDHSDLVGASPGGAAPTTSLFSA